MRDMAQTTPLPLMQPLLTLPSRPTVNFGLRITQHQRTVLDRLSRDLDCAPSTLARLALARGLELMENERK